MVENIFKHTCYLFEIHTSSDFSLLYTETLCKAKNIIYNF